MFDTEAEPLHWPLQATSVKLIVADEGPLELLKGMVTVMVQALASETTTVYTPALSPVTTVKVDCADGTGGSY